MRVGIDEQLIVRARLHARAAADAARRIQIDDAVAAFEEGPRRADPDAGSVGALVAEDREEEAPGFRERSFFDGLHPAAIHADGDFVLGFAGDRARMTSDALPEVYSEPECGHGV